MKITLRMRSNFHTQHLTISPKLPKEITDFLLVNDNPGILRYFTERRLWPRTVLPNHKVRRRSFALFLLFLFVDQRSDSPDSFFMPIQGSGSQTPDISGHRGRPCILSRPQQLPVCRRDRTHRRRQKCRGLMYALTTV